MKPATKIMSHVRRGVHKVAYGNPLYQKILSSGEVAERLHFTFPDLWPGQAEAGLAMISEQRSMFEKNTSARRITDDLRNLRAVGTERARQVAVGLVRDGMVRCSAWNDKDWTPSALGERLAAWIGFFEFYGPAADTEFCAALTESLQKQWKHLLRTLPSSLSGLAGLETLHGLIYGALNFPEGDKALGVACDMLRRLIGIEILSDGSHRSRNPSIQLHGLRFLLDFRAVFQAADLPVPQEVSLAISAMAPVLKFYRQGDGALALFHGSREENSLTIEATLNLAEVKGRMPRRLSEGAYERITAGRSLLIVDCGPPPENGHAGPLSFEFSQSRERIIVNCGALQNADCNWRFAMAATAAHSTITIDDTNACEVSSEGNVHSMLRCLAHRYEQAGSQGLEMRHDGYLSNFSLIHQRILELSGDGDELMGRDILESPPGLAYSLRWHLHPSVAVSLAQNAQTALMKTPSGSGWRLRVERGSLGLEPSVYCGDGTARRSAQLLSNGITGPNATIIIWRLTRERKA